MNRAKKVEKKKYKVKEDQSEFEFCKVCRINHNQGRRHNFFPRHTNSLSSLLSRFNEKLSDLKFFLKNPSLLLPAHSSCDRLWCIFCDSDIDELDSSFARGNAIEHLASEDHLKNLKRFLWNYGGGKNKVDSFIIAEHELAKWKKRCEVLKSEATSSSKIYDGSSHGPSNDIQPNYEIMNNFDKNNMHFFEPSLSKNVTPLQYDTNENYQVLHSDISKGDKVGPLLYDHVSPMLRASENGFNTSSLTWHGSQTPLASSSTKFLADSPVNSGVRKNESMANGEPIPAGYQNLTQIFSGGLEGIKGNVHSGALPPWLEGIEAHSENGQPRGPRVYRTQKNTRKTNQLNPKRVGAAWAEKRKLELEMEKRGEIIANDSDVDWLPNFGRVWQSGSRKESMKEFKKEKLNVPKPESQAESEIKSHPYISKRMRRDANGVSSEDVKSGDVS